MLWGPEHLYNSKGRVYGELNTGDWWNEQQALIAPDGTVLPLIFMSDETHMTNFSGDQKAWPIYLTIGNFQGSIRQKPSMKTVLLVGLMPIPEKLKDLKTSDYNLQKEKNRMIHQAVLQHILGPLLDNQCQDAGGNLVSYVWGCADDKKRRFFPRIAGWLADYPEIRDLMGMRNNRCPWCECPEKELGDLPECYGIQDDSNFTELDWTYPWPLRDYRSYAELLQQGEVGNFKAIGIHLHPNVFWTAPGNPADIPKPDILHTMCLGVLKHLLNWLHDFLKKIKLFDKFNAIWLTAPSYHEMSHPTRTYREVTQWQGKEIRVMARFLLAVLAATLREDMPGIHREDIAKANSATRGILEFHIYSSYAQHDDNTLRLMRNALRQFHHAKDVFRPFRVNKKVIQAVTKYRAKKNAERDAALDKLSKRQKPQHRKAWDKKIAKEVQDFREQAPHFNIPKLHLLIHYTDQIQRFGSLSPMSTEACESAHKTFIKKAYLATNRNGDLSLQMINYIERNHAFDMKDPNDLALRNTLAFHQEVNKAAEGPDADEPRLRAAPATMRAPDIPDDASQADSESESDIPMLDLWGIQNRRVFNGKTIRSFYELEEYVGHDDFRVSLYHFLVEKELIPRGQSSLQELDDVKVMLYHGLKVPVREFDTINWLTHTLHSTVSADFYMQGPRNDWAWYRPTTQESNSNQYRALRGRLPFQIRCFFKITSAPWLKSILLLAFGQNMAVLDGGELEGWNAQPRVERSDFSVIEVSQIEGYAHLIAELNPLTQKTWNYVWEE